MGRAAAIEVLDECAVFRGGKGGSLHCHRLNE